MSFFGALVIAGGASVVVAMLRLANRRRVRAAAAASVHAIGPGGILVGAESIHLVGAGDRGIFLLHGFNDTPQSVKQLARALHERGWTVSAPLLPHHGRGTEELEKHGKSAEWIAYARAEWQAFQTRVPRAVLGGQSMGGAIAVSLAAETSPRALVLLAPYLTMSPLPQGLAWIWPLWQLVVPELVSDPRRGLHDPVAREQTVGGGRFTPRLVFELKKIVTDARLALPRVVLPTLVIHSRADYRIPTASAANAFAKLGAPDKTLVWRENTGHVVAADTGREGVYAIVGEWLDAKVPAA